MSASRDTREEGSDPYFDLVVVGAGINGSAIAREAAARRLDVLLLDQADFGGGTTSASTRLIHGGLRYLEHGEVALVRESLREREALLALAPHLVEPLGLYLPIYVGGRRARWQIDIGLRVYDWLSLGRSLPGHRMLSRDELLERLPGLAEQGLAAGAFYYDAQVSFPERLVIENIVDAAEHGARVMNYTRLTGITTADGAVAGVEWRDRRGRAGRAAARIVVNAAGPWVDDVLASVAGAGAGTGAEGGSGVDDADARASRAPVSGGARLVGGTKGSHLIVERFSDAPDAAVYTEAASDGRPFFVIPWNGMYLIGTTDERYRGDPGEATIGEEELAYLVEETERLFPRCGGVAPHVLYTQSGVRPLPYEPDKEEAAVTRRHLIHAHARVAGLYSVVGGKLTTHRAVARQVLERLRRDHELAASEPLGEDRPLPGAAPPAARDALLAELGQRFGDAAAARLWHTYGARAARLLERVRAEPALGEPAAPGLALLCVELSHAVEEEWALTLIDVLQRRCMLGLGPDFGLAAAPAAAAVLSRLGLWDRARAEQEVAGYRAYARRFRVRALGAEPYSPG